MPDSVIIPARYFAPLVPVLTRFALGLRFRRSMNQVLPELAQERDLHRTFIFSLAGFSFTAVAGLAALDSTARVGLQLPTWYVLVSFIAFMSSMNAQSYKARRWQNQLAATLTDMGTFSLTLGLVALLFTAKFDPAFQWSATVITLGAWLIDHVIRLTIEGYHLSRL